jgi:hypothetical protein
VILSTYIGEPTVLELTDLADCAAFDRRFACNDQALASRHDPNPADSTSADGFAVDSDPCERRNLEKVRPVIEQEFDALAGQQLPARQMPLDVMFAAARSGSSQLGSQSGNCRPTSKCGWPG